MEGHRGDLDRRTRQFQKLDEFVQRVLVREEPADHTRELDTAAAEVFRAFAAAGISALLLKGPALARLLYTDAEVRDYSDIDLLVAPKNLAGGRAALAELGFAKSGDALGIVDVAGVNHAETWVAFRRGDDDASRELLLELHLWLPGVRAPSEVAWNRLVPHQTRIELCGQRVPVLNQGGQAFHLALHAAQHGTLYVRPQRELALALERWPFPVWEQAAALAAEVDAIDLFAAGLRLVSEGAELAETLELPSTDQLDWEIRHRTARPRGTFHLQALLEQRGLSGRARVFRHALLPSRAWMARKYRWTGRGGVILVLGYAAHWASAPAWVIRAWRFQRRARRAARR